VARISQGRGTRSSCSRTPGENVSGGGVRRGTEHCGDAIRNIKVDLVGEEEGQRPSKIGVLSIGDIGGEI